MLLIASLIMRGAAIEFRHAAAPAYKLLWDRVFGLGSLLAAIAQGIVLGRLLTGLQPGALHVGFVIITVIGVVSGYALLGATWLVKKTVGWLQHTARRYAIVALCATVACALGVTIGTWVVTPVGSAHWTHPGVFHVLAFLGLMAAAASCYVVYATARGGDHGPFNGSRVLFLISFIGLAVSLFPDLVPGHLTVAEAASDSSTLVFMLLGIGMVLPIMITYNLHQYRSFKGKISSAEH
jgi:cytochrome d ubiquinol oxidase subunit II